MLRTDLSITVTGTVNCVIPGSRVCRLVAGLVVWFAALCAVDVSSPPSNAQEFRLFSNNPATAPLDETRDDENARAGLEAGLLAAGLDATLLGGRSLPGDRSGDGPMALGLVEAVERGLERNLGLYLRDQQRREAEAGRREDLARSLPKLSFDIAGRRAEFNFEASPFSLFRPEDGAGGEAVVVFDTFDSRLTLSQTLVDVPSWRRQRSSLALSEAADAAYQEVRNGVALLVGTLYYRVLAAEVRLHAAEAREETADALRDLAGDRLNQGLSPRIDLLRAEVYLQTEIQRLLSAQASLEKATMNLARVLGLSAGQKFALTDELRFVPLPALSIEQAMDQAQVNRPDFRRLRSLIEAAAARAGSRAAEHLPTLRLDADYGFVGQTLEGARGTYGVSARLSLPLFSGGRLRARTDEAAAQHLGLVARYEDLARRAEFELREALLDERTGAQGVTVAERTRQLAAQQLADARDRFAAGVSGSLEVVAAQEAAASADEVWINALFAHRLAKGALARALGLDDQVILEALRQETHKTESASGAPKNGGSPSSGPRRSSSGTPPPGVHP